MKSLKAIFIITLAVFLCYACSSQAPKKEKKDKAAKRAAQANNNAAASTGDTTQTADVGAVYREKCAMCHSEDGKGATKTTPNFTDAAWQKKFTDEQFASAIKNGVKPMPAFGDQLSDEQVKTLVTYVRKFGK